MELKDMKEAELRAVLFVAEQLVAHQGGPSGSLGSFNDKDDAEREQWIKESQEAARAFAQARRDGKRTRSYNQDTPLQREGVQSALDWLRRKRPRKN
jgi:hypothetical protein